MEMGNGLVRSELTWCTLEFLKLGIEKHRPQKGQENGTFFRVQFCVGSFCPLKDVTRVILDGNISCCQIGFLH